MAAVIELAALTKRYGGLVAVDGTSGAGGLKPSEACGRTVL